ncbi:uncharacterized protein MONOS_12046 [Monocercomonoides exilis]|uniref:uncharacterized protein n=1 Tax=Monocercomonoides exilis TaxID=2049356 RepID=UPI003559F4B3|nr:hypothetical protein MONOS_12046 [Monocercomonoides exilis]|eukprot:MONOS_12046.1-p1 / transcript=MONOS_12046.1 / gene=MONOS_12046 / organism=Monocercomonoides_exilis_PA203 / gene_product=unspecified product / transcript_product=unspecified product / location=Mono_scaffold00639:27083-27511(-) / protein_length=143 / sequence_SO=supercontig / SO=protein_coding / is_pseudo=false
MLSASLVAQILSFAVLVNTVWEKADLFCSGCECVLAGYNLFAPSLLPSAIVLMEFLSSQSMRLITKIDDEVMERGVTLNEVVEIVEKGLDTVELWMWEAVLSPAAIAPGVLEEREEAEKDKEEKMMRRRWKKKMKWEIKRSE